MFNDQLPEDSRGNKDSEYLQKELEEPYNSFLFKYGGHTVYLIFFVGLFLNGSIATLHFKNSQWLFGLWALFSIVLLPKATLGIILFLGRKTLVFMNMPRIIWRIFPGTMQNYESIEGKFSTSLNPVMKGMKEIIWLIMSLIPIIAYIYQS